MDPYALQLKILFVQPKIEPDLLLSVNCQNAVVEPRNRQM